MSIDRTIEKLLMLESLPLKLISGAARSPHEAYEELTSSKGAKHIATLSHVIRPAFDEVIQGLERMLSSSSYDMDEVVRIGKTLSNPYLVAYVILLDTGDGHGPVRTRKMKGIPALMQKFVKKLRAMEVVEGDCKKLVSELKKVRKVL